MEKNYKMKTSTDKEEEYHLPKRLMNFFTLVIPFQPMDWNAGWNP